MSVPDSRFVDVHVFCVQDATEDDLRELVEKLDEKGYLAGESRRVDTVRPGVYRVYGRFDGHPNVGYGFTSDGVRVVENQIWASDFTFLFEEVLGKEGFTYARSQTRLRSVDFWSSDLPRNVPLFKSIFESS